MDPNLIAAMIIEDADPARMARAVALACEADEEFARQCALRGVTLDRALSAPLEWMSTPADERLGIN